MDKFQKIAFESQLAAVILGNGTEFELVALTGLLSEERTRELQARKFSFVGIVGLIEGRPRTALAEPLDELSSVALAQAYVALIENRINESAKAVGDGTEWLTHLYQLPDTRKN